VLVSCKLILFYTHKNRKEEKLFVVALRDSGMPTDTIATKTGVFKNTVEKWVNEKVFISCNIETKFELLLCHAAFR
jgi:DNA invertase Pin-like site-specific DNA recombinase